MGLCESLVCRFCRGANDLSTQRIIAGMVYLHPGLMLLDHIHFQYNGFLYGILLWSLVMAREVSAVTS
jgi:alpha-1,3-glucosyltransferase